MWIYIPIITQAADAGAKKEMRFDPLVMITQVTSWEAFYNRLSVEFGNQPEYKKLKGDAFEHLTKYYLLTEPIYASTFRNIYHHSEIPIVIKDQLLLPHPEVGVDLIAELYDGSYCAIQCKFHEDPNRNVSYDELSTFFSVTERRETFEKLSNRLICTSAKEISKTVSKLHNDKMGFITLMNYEGLNEERFEAIHELIKGSAKKFKAAEPRHHQIIALENVGRYFNSSGSDRGKIIHPCGSGKSLTAFWTAKNLGANKVLLAVPSLALIRQTLTVWAKESLANNLPISFMAVCSDEEINDSDDQALRTQDLGISVTTDPNKVIEFLQSARDGIKLLLTTYQSGEVVISASRELGYVFDLGIFDEAHKTVGQKDRKFSLLIDDDRISIGKKIFMTATERQFRGDSTDLYSMDDKKIYGDIIDELSFRGALEQSPPILCDYRLITVIVTKRDIEFLINENSMTKTNGLAYSFFEDGTTVAALIALRKLVLERDIKHAISFHKSIARAKDFSYLNDFINNNTTKLGYVHPYHVSGHMGTSDRQAEINRFIANTPSVISNARCLTEGVDIPAVDAVVFADPKQSVVDIVQAAGRAMRLSKDKDFGYIIIPVIIDEEKSDVYNQAFKQLITVIAALGMSDDRIIDEVKEHVARKEKATKSIIEFVSSNPTTDVNFSDLIDHLEIKIWDRLSFAKSVIGEADFQTWMQNCTTLSPKSIKNYGQAIRKISNDLVKLELAFSTLDDITENANLIELKNKYFSIQEYRELDIRGKSMYSAGFNKLIEYQKFKVTQAAIAQSVASL